MEKFTNLLEKIDGYVWGIPLIVLIISAVREMWDKAIKDKGEIVIYLIALLIMLFSKISPAYIIIASIFVGIGYKLIQKKRGKE